MLTSLRCAARVSIVAMGLSLVLPAVGLAQTSDRELLQERIEANKQRQEEQRQRAETKSSRTRIVPDGENLRRARREHRTGQRSLPVNPQTNRSKLVEQY